MYIVHVKDELRVKNVHFSLIVLFIHANDILLLKYCVLACFLLCDTLHWINHTSNRTPRNESRDTIVSELVVILYGMLDLVALEFLSSIPKRVNYPLH